MNNRLKILLKLILAMSLVGWLLKSERLDFGLVSRAFFENQWWPLAVGVIILNSFLASTRWKSLLQKGAKKTFSNTEIFKITWIGMFFNTFLPGAVSGDFIKLVYVKDLDASFSKTYLILTVLMDRVLGLIGLIVVMGVMSLVSVFFTQHELVNIQRFLPFNMVLFSGAIVFLSCLFAPKRLQNKILPRFQKIPLIGEQLGRTLEQIWRIGASKQLVFFALILSFLTQFGTILVFWLLTFPFYETHVPFATLFMFIPIGLISMAIPISPAGLGVGHLVFEGLFKIVGVSGGASLFNIFFMTIVSLNFLGLIPYVLHKKPLPSAEEEQDFLNERSPS